MDNIKVFAFDFDGVILDSAGIKISVFDEIFDRFPEHSERMKAYNRRNAGYSRYVQFRYFYEELMGLRYDADTENAVVGEFAEKVLERVLSAPFIDGVLEFIETCRRRGSNTYIVTGTPQEDIRYITAQKGIADYFDGIYGSPELKEDILARIIIDNHIESNQLMFYGDAMSDLDAARSAGTQFIGVGTLTQFPDGVSRIRDFVGSGAAL